MEAWDGLSGGPVGRRSQAAFLPSPSGSGAGNGQAGLPRAVAAGENPTSIVFFFFLGF